MYQRTFRVTEAEGSGRLDQFMEGRLPGVSRTAVRRTIRNGEVRVNGEVWDAGLRVSPGDFVELETPVEPVASLLPEAIPLDVAFEDDTLLVVDKPAGMLAHPTSSVHGGTLANALGHYLGRRDDEAVTHPGPARPGLVHRLDQPTSGLMVVAKTPRAHERLARAFRERRIEKRYLALVCGRPDAAEGVIDAPIGHDPNAHPRWGVRETGRAAQTRYVCGDLRGPYTLVELEPLTGRTNQLRIHAAHAGWPIAGDPLHGAEQIERFLARHPGTPAPGRLFLHAFRLAFAHPETGAPIEVEASLPGELARFLEGLE
jgi:23S rRNA pseudouridine1911/1915/1917 synthase